MDEGHINTTLKNEKGQMEIRFLLNQYLPKQELTNEEYVNSDGRIEYWVKTFTDNRPSMKLVSQGLKKMWGIDVINIVLTGVDENNKTLNIDIDVFVNKGIVYYISAYTAENCPEELHKTLDDIVASVTLN